MKRGPEVYSVTLVRPEGVSVQMMKEYIADAVASMKGSYHPDDDIFYLDRDTIRVTKPRNPRTVKS